MKKKINNVFSDIGVPNPEAESFRADLTWQIYLLLKTLKLSQVEAAKILKIPQPDVSNLIKGRYTGFSAERLFRLLRRLGQEIEIVIRPRIRSVNSKTVRIKVAA